jgi:hypothetical protein
VTTLRRLLAECFTSEYRCFGEVIADHIGAHFSVEGWATWLALQLDANEATS